MSETLLNARRDGRGATHQPGLALLHPDCLEEGNAPRDNRHCEDPLASLPRGYFEARGKDREYGDKRLDGSLSDKEYAGERPGCH